MKRMSILVLLLAFGLLAAACSGGESDSGVATLDEETPTEQNTEQATSDTPSQEEAVIAFTACLRDEGLDVEDPTVDADGNLRPPRVRDLESTDREVAGAAFEACGAYLENVTFGLDSEDRTEREDELFAFAACMRDNGYDMPDPDFSTRGTPGQGGGGPFGGALETDDPAFQTALEACGDMFGGERPIPGTSGGQG